MEDASVGFCHDLARRSVGVRDLLTQHVADYDELLPHVLMADIGRLVLSGSNERRQIVAQLEAAMRNGREDLRNLIGVSFVENLASEEELERALAGVDSDALREEWRRQHEAE